MLHLHYGNRLEDLLPPLAESVRAQQARDPLEPVTIVVPNRAVSAFVKFELAERLGVAANIRTRYLQAHLADLVSFADARIRIIEKGQIELLIANRLRARTALDASEMEPVRRYLGRAARAPGDEDADRDTKPSIDFERRALDLARETARLFLEYAFSRREMVKRWHAGEAAGDGAPTRAEAWQRRLWLSLFDEDGAFRDPEGRVASVRWMLLPDAMETVDLRGLDALCPLHLFGLPSLAPAFADIFARLATVMDVRLYALSPCPEFREDVGGGRPADGPAWASREDRIGPAIASDENPFHLNLPGENRALRLWSRPAREHIRLLNELGTPEIHPLFPDPDSPGSPSLLGRIQAGIRRRIPAGAGTPPIKDPAKDASILFLACPGPRREVEIIANEIWALLQAPSGKSGDSRGPVRFHEIGVLLPDNALDAYTPHVEAVFEELHRIPVNLLHRRLASESRVAEAVDLLLRLPLGNFDRHEMVRVLTHEAVAGRHPDVDPARWRIWCEQLRVVFGASRESWRGTYVHPRDLFNWDQALGRLALGAFVAGEPSGMTWFFGDGDSARPPYETSQGDWVSVARFLSLARRLLAEARACAGARLTLREWAGHLVALTRAYVRPLGPEDERILERCIEGIAAMGETELEPVPVPYAVAQEIAASSITNIEAERGQYTRGGVAVGSLAALAGIPFRVIFLAGLCEGVFPSRDRNDLIDLRLARRRAGDVTPAERDRALFMQALLSARDRVVLSYVSRDAQTGEALEPSTVVREFQSVVRDVAGREAVERLTVSHPVSRYAPAYFPDLDPGARERLLASVDPGSRRGARITILREDLRRRLGNRPLPDTPQTLFDLLDPEARRRLGPAFDLRTPSENMQDARLAADRIPLSIAALRRFIECPLQGAARHALGIFEDEEEEREERAEEPIIQSALQASILLREAFWLGEGDPRRAMDAYVDLLGRAEKKGEAPVGPFAVVTRRGAEHTLRAWHESLRAIGLHDVAGWEALRIGRTEEFARVRQPLPPILFPVRLPQPDGGERTVTAMLHGTTEVLSPRRDASIRCVLREKPKEKDYLGLFLSSVIVSALGDPAARPFQAVVVSNQKKADEGRGRRRAGAEAHRKNFDPLSREEALAYLGLLARDLLAGPNDTFFPFEAALSAYKALRNDPERPLVPLIEGMREDRSEHHACSSDRGPVKVAHRFPPPSEEEVRRLLQTRYEPLFARLLAEEEEA